MKPFQKLPNTKCVGPFLWTAPISLSFDLFSWSIIALQSCVSFCCTTTAKDANNNTHTHIYIYIYISPLPLEPPSHPSRSSQGTALVPVVCGSFPLAISFTHGSVYMLMLHSRPSLCPNVRSLHVSLFLPCK